METINLIYAILGTATAIVLLTVTIGEFINDKNDNDG